jgi:hypothetical protein
MMEMSFFFIEVENKEGGLTKNKAGGLLTCKWTKEFTRM